MSPLWLLFCSLFSESLMLKERNWHYHAASGSWPWQNWGFLKSLRVILQCMWLVGFCQMASSPFCTTFFQHRLLAILSITFCSAFRSSAVLSHPFHRFSQLIGGPDKIQYPPGRKIRSTSIKYCPSDHIKNPTIKSNLKTKLVHIFVDSPLYQNYW